MMISNETVMLSAEAGKTFPFVHDKLICDFVNGLDVANELNFQNKKRNGLAARFFDGLSGTSAMRQHHINDHLLNGLEACRQLFHEISGDVEKHSVAIIRINKSLQHTQQNITKLAQYTIDFKSEFKEFTQKTQRQFIDLEQNLNATKRLVLADQQLSRLMDKWAAGGYDDLSPIARAYVVIDSLKWGAFGERMRLDGEYVDFIRHLEDKLLVQLKRDLEVDNTSIGILKEDWTRHSNDISKELVEVLEFQGDWCLDEPDSYAVTILATQPLLPEFKHIVPNIPTVSRVIKNLVSDSFMENVYA